MKESLGFYRITYDNDFVQTKELISVASFKHYELLEAERSAIKFALKKNKKDITLLNNLDVIEKDINVYKFPFFVVGSPMHKGLTTGILSLPETQGGDSKIKIEKIGENEVAVFLEDDYDE